MKGLKFKLNIRYWGARFLFFGFFAFLIPIVFFFKVSEISFFGFTLSNPLFIYTAELSWKIYLLIYFIFVFLINSFIFMLLTVLIRHNKIRSENRINKYEKIITDKIIDLVYEDFASTAVTNEKKLDELKASVSEEFTKIILLDILRKIHSQVKDEARLKIVDIMEKLNLNDFIKAYLHSPYFRDKIFAMKIISEFELGMRDVFQFENNEFHDYIIKLTRERNYVLRTEAFVSLIKLAMHDDLSFLLDRELHVSLWDMNVVLKVFRDIKNNYINYSQLIQSDTPRVAALGILLANKHNRSELKDIIKNRIGSKDATLNYEAYSASISMATDEADYQFFIKNFNNEELIIKKAIVKSFINCPSLELSKSFMKYVIEEESLPLKVDALKLLVEIDVNLVNEYKHSANIDIIKARNQIVDFNLN